jgi:hypothetical protein
VTTILIHNRKRDGSVACPPVYRDGRAWTAFYLRPGVASLEVIHWEAMLASDHEKADGLRAAVAEGLVGPEDALAPPAPKPPPAAPPEPTAAEPGPVVESSDPSEADTVETPAPGPGVIRGRKRRATS